MHCLKGQEIIKNDIQEDGFLKITHSFIQQPLRSPDLNLCNLQFIIIIEPEKYRKSLQLIYFEISALNYSSAQLLQDLLSIAFKMITNSFFQSDIKILPEYRVTASQYNEESNQNRANPHNPPIPDKQLPSIQTYKSLQGKKLP